MASLEVDVVWLAVGILFFVTLVVYLIKLLNSVKQENDELKVKIILHNQELSDAEKAARKDSTNRQRAILKGQISETLAPWSIDAVNSVKELSFLGNPIDFIGFKLKNKASETESKVDDQLIPFAVDMAKVITIVLGIVMILGNVFDVNIAALVTGLGIGGVAFALASKESLENLLGSFTIFFDKPFTVGDIVTLGGVTGIVEKVGFRSTRIRTFDKSVVTVPNKNIISSELDNLGARPVRRVKFNIGLTYDSSVNNIKAIVNDIQDLIDKHPDTNNDGKVRFLNFGPSSLDIMVLYYVNSPDWEVLINTQEKINYSIIDIVSKHKCDFAFPSTSVYIEKNNN